MLYSVRGKLIHMEQGFAVIECGGVGYKCITTFNTQKSLPKLNNEVMLYTYLNVRQDAVELFGFADESELNCYKLLTAVNGVGSKAAIAILSELSPDKLAVAIASSDAKAITRAQGVGPKLAQRVILELKDKVENLSVSSNGFDAVNISEVTKGDDNRAKAVTALGVLGYNSSEVAPILSAMDKTLSVEQLISAVLKEMGRK